MRAVDWIPVSASALVAGVIALAMAAILLPIATPDSERSLVLVRGDDGHLLAVSALFVFAAVAMMCGLPCLHSLFVRRGGRLGTAALVALAAGFVGMAGYAILLGVLNLLVPRSGMDGQPLLDITGHSGLSVYLYAWVSALYLGVLLIALALLRTRTAPVWVPVLLIVQVALLPVLTSLPHALQSGSALMMAVGFSGLAISANNAEIAR